MQCRPLTGHTLPPEQLAADRAAAQRLGNSAVGEKALYLPGRFLPRARYLPIECIQRAYLRLVVGEKPHRQFRQPLLVLVVDGIEYLFLYQRETVVRAILAALFGRGVPVGKPKPPKPN